MKSPSNQPVLFTAVQRFDAATHAGWDAFVAWARLPQLVEVVSLDSSLCPSVLDSLTDEDWNHNVHEDFKTHLFRDPDSLVARIAGQPANVLGILEEPTTEALASFHDPSFEFCGFDLIEERTGISALTNCGGFDKAMARSELSPSGLLVDHARALAVRERLVIEYPDEPHADCVVWAIWRLKT